LQFTADESAPAPDKKLSKLQDKAGKTAEKLKTARDKLPSKEHIKKQRVYDEEKGKAKTKFAFEKEIIPQGAAKPPISERVGKAGGHAVVRAGANKLHQKVTEVEKENAGVEGAHKLERAAEGVYRSGKRATHSAYRFVKDRPYRTAAKLEKQAAKANSKLAYRTALNNNPKLKSNVISRMLQKRKIKREYAKAAREAARKGAIAAKRTGTFIGRAAQVVVAFVRRNPVVLGIIGLILLIVFFVMSLFSSCSNMGMSVGGAVMASSYVAEDADIDNAELFYTELETDLLLQVESAEIDHPGYDEYRYSVADVGHNPYELMAFLTATRQAFLFSDVQAILRQVFEEQYSLSFTEEVETRYNDPDDENEDGDLEPYEWRILNVNLTAQPFTDVVAPRISGDEWEIYNLLMQTKGNRQYLQNPFGATNWLPYVSSFYGYRVHPITGEKDYHKAADIAMPEGTEILAGHDGTVTTAALDASYGNYIVLEGDEGLVSKYAHCSVLLVGAGQTVQAGDVIARVGNTGDSTGPHLHLEILKNGQYLNPLYFAVTGDDGSGSLPPGTPGGPAYAENPGAAMGDGSYAALIAEAERHLGKPYVFGAKGPDSFDCSSFVSWSLTHSGVRNISTNAQGLYNASTPVSPSDARPGDLIFFHSTYSTSNTVTHVGIYVGNGMMLNAGSPIQYASIDTSYWQSHFYAFGRII
jgi:murein DD-endopeptidase MepM/ murein hydrolase activator NlpD